MPQTCSVCANERRREIDQDIVSGKSMRYIALRYGTTKDSAQRHRDCITELLNRADAANGRSIRSRVEKLLVHLERMVEDVASEGRPGYGMLLQAVRELRPTLMLMGQVNGEITSPTVQAFMIQIGAPDESYLRSALDLRRSMSVASVEDMEQELLASMRFLLAERPEFRERALEALGVVPESEVVADEPKRITNGNATNGGPHD